MDVLDWLKVVVSRCQAVTRPGDALALLPDLGVDAPSLVELPVAGSPLLCAPVAFARELCPALSSSLAAVLSQAKAGQAAVARPSPDELADDPLTQALTRLLLESAVYGPRAASLVMLELCRESALVLNGDPSSLRAFGAADLGRANNAADDINKLAVAPRAAALRLVSGALAARLGVAWALASSIDPSLRPTRLYQALLRNRAALLFPSGGLAFPNDAAVLAGVSDSRAEASVISGLYTAAMTGISQGLADTSGRAAQSLRDLAGRRADAEALARDPRVATWALHNMGELSDTKSLTAAGVSKALAKALIKGDGVAAMVSSYTALLGDFRSWELLSQIAAFSEPVWEDGGRWRCAGGALDRRGPWALLGPRGGAGVVEASVVAVRRAELYAAAVEVAQEKGTPAVLSALEARWRELVEEAAQLGGAVDQGGQTWLAAFTDDKASGEFAKRVAKRFEPRVRLELGLGVGEVALPDRATVAVAEHRGLVFGGWDGQALRLQGAAVEQALAELPAADQAPAGLGSFSAGDFASLAPEPAAEEPTQEIDPFSSEAPTLSPSEEPTVSDPFAFSPPAQSGGSLSDPFSEAPTVSSEMFDAVDDEVDDDPFGFAEPPAPEPPAPTPPVPEPAAAEAMDDPFMGVPEMPPGEQHGEDPFEDPLAAPANQTLSPSAIGWESEDDADPFGSDPFDTSEPPAASGGIVSFEIDDDDDSEISVDIPAAAEDSEMFFLPPPAEGESEENVSDGESSPGFAFADPPTFERAATELGEDADDPFALAYERAGELENDDLDGPDIYTFADQTKTVTHEVPDFADVLDDREQLSPEEASEVPSFSFGDGDIDFSFDDPAPSAEVVEATPPSAPEPQRAPEAAAQEAPQEPMASSGMLRLSAAEVAYMFNGYVALKADGQVIFGRRYGDRLIDVHQYPETGRDDRAYLNFVTDKIREGFLPQTEMSRPIGPGEDAASLDLDLIGRALSDLGTG